MVDDKEQIVSIQFCTYIKIRIESNKWKNVFLLKELLKDVKKFISGT